MQNSSLSVVNIAGKFGIENNNALTPDQDTIGGVTNSSAATSSWQSLTTSGSGNYGKVDFYFTMTAGDYIVRIYSGAGVGGTLLYDQTHTLAGTTYPTPQTVILNTPVAVTSGAQYTVFLHKVTGTFTRFWSGPDVYAGGTNDVGVGDYRIVTYFTQSYTSLSYYQNGSKVNSGFSQWQDGTIAAQATTGSLIIPTLTEAQVTSLTSIAKKAGAILFNSTRKTFEFFSTVSNSFVDKNTFVLNATLDGGNNGTKTLLFGSTIARATREFNFQVSGGVFDTTINYPGGASMTVNIIKNGTTVSTQTFLGSAGTTPIRALTNVNTTPVSFTALDILTIQVVQAGFAGNPGLSVSLTCNSI